MHIYSKVWRRLLLCLPVIIIFCVYMIYPICNTIYTSFTRQIMLRPGWWVGFENYITLFKDEVFWRALKNTAIITIGTLVLQLPLAYLIGSFMNRPYKNGVFKTVTFMPYILSGIMAGLIWSFLLDSGFGLFNNILISFGAEGIEWIGGKTLTPYSATLVCVWQSVGYHSVLFLAGFKTMPKNLLEAANIDGANALQRTFYVTIPSIKETIKVSATAILIGGINHYQQTLMLTGGGPVHYSETLSTYAYYTQFTVFNFGYGAAMATIILILALGLSIAFLKLTTKKGDTA